MDTIGNINEKSISNYLHLYLGCSIDTNVSSAPHLQIGTTKYKVIDKDNYKRIIDFITEEEWDYYCKPILRPLSDMLEDERKEIFKLVFNRPFNESGRIDWHDKKTLLQEPRWVLSSGISRLGIQMNGEIWADCDLQNWKFNPHEITHYLLKQGFDLFNLIPEGLAIDKTTLNK